MNKNQLAIFENFKIRRYFDEKNEMWYFSVVDIVAVLTDSINPTDYLKKLRKRDFEVGAYMGTNCPQIEMLTDTGKFRKTLAGNPEHLLRIIQSIPSKKAEPIKLWLAKVGYERMQEMGDPEIGINRARDNWLKHGRSKQWIQQRMMGQGIRNKLTDYWKDNEVKEKREYAILTNIIHQEWSDMSVRDHKNIKSLKMQNLRDHMTDAELIFTALAELSTRQIAETMRTKGLEENKIPAIKGGQIAKGARKELETKTGKMVVSGKNFLLQKSKKRKL